MSAEKVNAYQCDACEVIVEEPDQDPLYDCGVCGEIFNRSGSYSGDGHQCPNCRRFSSKLSDTSCPECGVGPMESIEAWRTKSGELVEDEPEEEPEDDTEVQ